MKWTELQNLKPAGGGLDFGHVMRLVASGLGLVIMLFGLWCTVRIFQGTLEHLRNPDLMEATLARWRAHLGDEEIYFYLGQGRYPMSRLIVFAVLGLGIGFLGWLSLGLVVAGARAIAAASSEKNAIRRIVREALDKSGPSPPAV
jgi:hypothetical protein